MRLKAMLKPIMMLLAIAALSSAAFGASTLPSGMENPLPLFYPELTTSPAPSWLTEGTRATYSVIASTSDTEYSENIEWSTGNPGAGLTQVDLVALEDGIAATHTQPYTPDLQGAMRLLIGFGSVVPAGCGDFWCDPQVLNNIPEQAGDRLMVQHLPVTIGGENYQAIRFDYNNEGLKMALVYDLETGVMLYHTMDYTSYGMEESKLTTSRASHAIYELRSLRSLKIPWKDGSVPLWLSAGQTYYYQGSTEIYLPGATPSAFPLSVQMTIGTVHGRFTEAREDTYTSDPVPPPYVNTVYGAAQLMGGWLPPEASSTPPGIIDTDPETGMQVSMVQNDESGIVLEMTNQFDWREVFTYDTSGKLISTYQEFNPDIITSSGFASTKTILLQLVM